MSKGTAGKLCVAAGLGVAVLGWILTTRLHWLAAGFVLAAVGLGLLRITAGGPGVERVAYDDEGVFRTVAEGGRESVRWDQLAAIEIVTTDQGPWLDDVFWLLTGEDGGGCAVPSQADGMQQLLRRLQQLPGFDNEAVIRAMGSTSNARFQVWKRAT